MDNTEYVECKCGSFPHLLRFYVAEDGSVEVEYLLKGYLPWYKRIYHGIRYILGFDVGQNLYDCSILDWDAQNKIIKLFNEVAHERRRTYLLNYDCGDGK